MSAVATPPEAGFDRDAVIADLTQNVTRLRLQEQLLELDVEGDPTVKEELETVKSDLAERETMLRKLLGQQRDDRRAREARKAEEAERRRGHVARARELQVERVAAARAIDSALRKFAAALADHDRLCREQEKEFRWAGERQLADIAQPRAWRLNGAMRRALLDAGVRGGAIELPLYQQSHVKPMVELDPRPVEPEPRAS